MLPLGNQAVALLNSRKGAEELSWSKVTNSGYCGERDGHDALQEQLA